MIHSADNFFSGSAYSSTNNNSSNGSLEMLNLLASLTVPVVFVLVTLTSYVRIAATMIHQRAGYLPLSLGPSQTADTHMSTTIHDEMAPVATNDADSDSDGNVGDNNTDADQQQDETTPLLQQSTLSSTWVTGTRLSLLTAALCCAVAAVESAQLLCESAVLGRANSYSDIASATANTVIWIILAVAIYWLSPAINTISYNTKHKVPSPVGPLSLLAWVNIIVHAFHIWQNTSTGSTAKRWLSLEMASIALSATLFAVEMVRSVQVESQNEDARVEHLATLTDASGERIPVPCGETTASLFSQIFFSWISPLVRKSSKISLEHADIWDLNPIDKSATIVARYTLLKDKYQSLTLKLFLIIWQRFTLTTLYCLFAAVLSLSSPFFVNRMIDFIEYPKVQPMSMGFVYAFGLFCTTILKSWANAHYFNSGRRTGIHLRTVLIAEIYQKSLRRRATASTAAGDTPAGKDKTTKKEDKADTANQKDAKKPPSNDDEASLGKIVTLMSVDTQRLREIVAYIPWLFITPLEIVACVLALFYILGWSAISGVAIMIISIPVVGMISKVQYKAGDVYMEKMDSRVGVVNELLQGIRIIKYFGWEGEFANKVNKARSAELWSLVLIFISNMLGSLAWDSIPILVSFFTFMTFTVVAGNTLTATIAFTSLSLFMTLRFPLMVFPSMLMDAVQALVSIRRIETFLAHPDLEKYQTGRESGSGHNWEYTAAHPGFEHASFTWENQAMSPEAKTAKDNVAEENTFEAASPPSLSVHDPLLSNTTVSNASQHHHFVLSDVHISLPVGALTTIVGLTGAGKSSITQALLGEMCTLKGRSVFPSVYSRTAPDFHQHDTGVAYVAQTAWLQNATIKSNILFGQPYDAVRYTRVIEACALTKDLATLPAGDLTEIGEKGINMSGGQKQRISLARACYSRAQSVILDDPLSAVDAPTALHLFEQCIKGLLSDRTVILVTHATGLVLPFSNYIVYVKNGRVAAQGTPEEIQAQLGTNSTDVFGNYLLDAIKGEKIEGEVSLTTSDDDSAPLAVVGDTKAEIAKGKLVDDETKQSGSVKSAIYMRYLYAVGGYLFLVMYVLLCTSGRTLQAMNDLWLKVWADSYSSNTQLNTTVLFAPDLSIMRSTVQTLSISQPIIETKTATYSPAYYIWVYGALGLSIVVCEQLILGLYAFGSYRASKEMHASLLNRILNAPMRFFDTTPIGRILNRFSKDIESIDTQVGQSTQEFVGSVFQTLCILVVVTSVSPIFPLLFIPVTLVFYQIARVFLLASRELRRLESVSQSPLYAKFSETLQGAATIRAFAAEDQFIKENMELVDRNHQAHFYLWACNRWLGIRCELAASTMVLMTTISLVMARDYLDPGLAGLCIAYSLELVFGFVWITRSHARMEMNMNAVERIDEYLNIEQDAAAVVDDYRPADQWPEQGCIEFKELCIRYSPEQPLVLDKVTFTVGAFEKVGIVGRTGAGKSTLSLAMFRIVPHDSGTILIDGMDIGKMGLWDLRSRLTIIPQDPVLFSGTVRSNLDPFDKHDDAALWTALKRVHFLESMQTRPGHSNGVNDQLANVSIDSSATLGHLFSDQNRSGDTSPSPTVIDEGLSHAQAEHNTITASSKGFSLELPVQENGTNFSQGQRQLLCLARALLQASRVIVLDEATASVDHSTDSRIQETIRTEFSNASVLTIAHRLSTVMDHDKILVLEQGKLAQYGLPHDLLQNKTGLLYQMCVESGEMDLLVSIAAAKAQSVSGLKQ
ncbi:hypothetical protein BASA50_004382 [Batrachochytrium salamandrivorans]|uniref:Uncharacterized protein n=1 Tax=Batrachochytrium salamandrivorans TaxID=1357716 RepID=A0ABQ8FFL9_9FUNG|nr:hypothetical protein BASA62_007797 [Batrachochytrium salamandrivorans]KAH6578668.1 hypothetical protein BASA61_000133 [Batrachochytrium salamandrivorans]KAH6597465.1 hypothetical protein BASA50_004382 [Batrachochytrium salamandrivorans]